ncbi:MAG TPA: hypothetical protein VGO57_05365 [Verrucomicrobiae bacterium]|jgi:hypothetical protein
MTIAPEPILRAANETILWACIFCRNHTLQAGVSAKMVNELMEAVHEVPKMVVDWDRHDLAELRAHLRCFQASHWPGAPDLAAYFDRKLEAFGYGGNYD